MTKISHSMSREELLSELLAGSVYDLLPEEYHSQSAIPADLYAEAFQKLKAKRLDLITQYSLAMQLEELDVTYNFALDQSTSPAFREGFDYAMQLVIESNRRRIEQLTPNRKERSERR